MLFSVDVIKQRLDSLEATLLSAHKRTSDAYSESMVNTTEQMTVTPTTLAQWTKGRKQWAGGTANSETCALATAANRADKPTVSRQNLEDCRQVGTSKVCGPNESKWGTWTGYKQTGTNVENKSIGDGESWKGRTSDVFRQVAANTCNRPEQNASHTTSSYTQMGHYTSEREGYGNTDPYERETYRHEGNSAREREGYGTLDPYKRETYRHEGYSAREREKFGALDPYKRETYRHEGYSARERERFGALDPYKRETYRHEGYSARERERFGALDPYKRETHRHEGYIAREGFGMIDPYKKETYRHEQNIDSEREGFGTTDPCDGKIYGHEATATEPRNKRLWTPQRTNAMACWGATNTSVSHSKTVAQQTDFTPYRPVSVGDDGELIKDFQRSREKTKSVCSPTLSRIRRNPTMDLREPQEKTMSVSSPSAARTSRDHTVDLLGQCERILSVHSPCIPRTNRQKTVDQQGPQNKTKSVSSPTATRTSRDPTVNQQGSQKRTSSVCNLAADRTSRDPTMDLRSPRVRTMSVCSPVSASAKRDLAVKAASKDSVGADKLGELRQVRHST